jgi:hypothetical protein
MSAVPVPFLATIITFCDMGVAFSDTVCKILKCAASAAACIDSLNEFSDLSCHMLTDLKNVSETL